MNFWNALKYILMVLLALILIGAVVVAQDETPKTQSAPQANQSKFNL